MFLRQSTSVTRRFGPFLDSTDGVTPETALTIAQADRQFSKNGGAFAQTSDTNNAAHDTDGYYSATFSTTDTNTVGELELQVTVAGALPVWRTWYVLEEEIYDALFASSAVAFDSNQRVNVGSWLSNAVTVTSGVPNVHLTAITDGVIPSVRRATAQSGSTSTTIILDTGASATSSWYNGMNVTIVAGTGAGQSRTILSYAGSTRTATVATAWTTPPDNTSIFVITPGRVDVSQWRGATPNALVSGRVDGSVGAMAANVITAAAINAAAITAAKFGAGAIDANAIASAAITAAKFAAGAIDAAAIATNAIDADALAADALTEIQNSCDAALVGRKLDKFFNAAITGADVTDNSYAAKIASKGSPADFDTFDNTSDSLEALIDGAATVNDVWDELIHSGSSHNAANSAAKFVATLAESIAGRTNNPTLNAMLGVPDSAGVTMVTQVNAEVSDVIKVDTITLPGQSAPPNAPTLQQAVSWLYKAFRNRKRQTSTTWELYADNETTIDSKATVSESGGIAIKQEIVSGP